MLSFLKKKIPSNEVIKAPLIGNVIESSQIPDETFAEEMLGMGVAFEPKEGKVYSPVDGTLSMVPKSKHAVTVTSDEGAEILIHIGLDTVSLKGGPFNVVLEEGSKVKAGDLLMEFDMEAIKAAGLSTISPVVICNSDDFKDVIRHTGKEANVGDMIMEIVR